MWGKKGCCNEGGGRIRGLLRETGGEQSGGRGRRRGVAGRSKKVEGSSKGE